MGELSILFYSCFGCFSWLVILIAHDADVRGRGKK